MIRSLPLVGFDRLVELEDHLETEISHYALGRPAPFGARGARAPPPSSRPLASYRVPAGLDLLRERAFFIVRTRVMIDLAFAASVELRAQRTQLRRIELELVDELPHFADTSQRHVQDRAPFTRDCRGPPHVATVTSESRSTRMPASNETRAGRWPVLIRKSSVTSPRPTRRRRLPSTRMIRRLRSALRTTASFRRRAQCVAQA